MEGNGCVETSRSAPPRSPHRAAATHPDTRPAPRVAAGGPPTANVAVTRRASGRCAPPSPGRCSRPRPTPPAASAAGRLADRDRRDDRAVAGSILETVESRLFGDPQPPRWSAQSAAGPSPTRTGLITGRRRLDLLDRRRVVAGNPHGAQATVSALGAQSRVDNVRGALVNRTRVELESDRLGACPPPRARRRRRRSRPRRSAAPDASVWRDALGVPVDALDRATTVVATQRAATADDGSPDPPATAMRSRPGPTAGRDAQPRSRAPGWRPTLSRRAAAAYGPSAAPAHRIGEAASPTPGVEPRPGEGSRRTEPRAPGGRPCAAPDGAGEPPSNTTNSSASPRPRRVARAPRRRAPRGRCREARIVLEDPMLEFAEPRPRLEAEFSTSRRGARYTPSASAWRPAR